MEDVNQKQETCLMIRGHIPQMVLAKQAPSFIKYVVGFFQEFLRDGTWYEKRQEV